MVLPSISEVLLDMQTLAALSKRLRSLPWLKAIPVIISLGAIFFSWRALQVSKKANDIAAQSRIESRRQFLSVNKPIIMVSQLRFGEGKGYFEVLPAEGDKIVIASLISIRNTGSIIAGNVFVHSVNSYLFIDGTKVERMELKNKPLNDGDNHSLIHIPSQEAITRIVRNVFRTPEPFKRGQIAQDRIMLMQNVLIYYYPDTKQTPNKEAEEKLYATNITNSIKYDWYETSLLTFLDKPSLSMPRS